MPREGRELTKEVISFYVLCGASLPACGIWRYFCDPRKVSREVTVIGNRTAKATSDLFSCNSATAVNRSGILTVTIGTVFFHRLFADSTSL